MQTEPELKHIDLDKEKEDDIKTETPEQKLEQQEKPEPEKITTPVPADVGLDIDVAKKYLDEIYGREKSGEGKNESLVQNGKQESKIFVPEEIGRARTPEEIKRYQEIREGGEKIVEGKKEIAKRESVAEEKRNRGELPSAVDLAYEKAKKISQETTRESEKKPEVKEPKTSVEKLEKEVSLEAEKKEPTAEEKLAEQERIKTAENELVNLAKSINEAKEKKETEVEASLYDKAKDVYKNATGNNLKEKAKERAKDEAKIEGFVIVTRKEFLSEERIKQMEDKIKQREWSIIIRNRFDALSIREQEKYFNGANNKDVDSAIAKFTSELESKRQDLDKKKVISLPKELFYQLIAEGYKPEDTKKRGFFGKMFLEGELEIPRLDKKDTRGPFTFSNKSNVTEWLIKDKEKRDVFFRGEAEEQLERKFMEGRKRWKAREQRNVRDTIQETAVKIIFSQQAESKQEPKEKPSVEIIEEGLKSFDTVSAIEKLMKRVVNNKKANEEAIKTMRELGKRIKRGEILTLREKASLNKIDSASRKKVA